MTITYGTANFRNKTFAEAYYAKLGYDDVRAVVQEKLREGEIFIGMPDLKPGQSFHWNSEGRAVIEESESK